MKLQTRFLLLGLVGAALLAACGGGGGSVAPPPPSVITVSVSPANVTVLTSATQQFTVTVTGTTNTGVNWSVEGVVGGNATVGRISAGGLYTAPAVPPSPSTVTVKATSVAEATKSDTAAVAVANPGPQLNSLSPSSVNAGSGDTTLTLTGSGFAQQSQVQAGGTGLAATFVSATQLRAVVPAAQLATAGALPITVVTPAPGGGTSAARNLTVLIAVEVSPAALTMDTGLEQQFTATVVGSANQAVTWLIEGAGSGNDFVGTISADGLYTAPIILPEPPTVTVQATSVADPLRFGSAAVTLASPLEDWPKYRRDLANTGRSLESVISSRNANRLQRKWNFDTGGKISASPAVATVGGVRTVYIGNWAGDFFAINADTGAQRWKFTIDKVGTACTTTPECRITSSPAVANGIVYFGTFTGHVYALNAATGALVWKTQHGDPDLGYEIWSSPAVSNGVVYVGVSSQDGVPCVVGRVEALDAATGAGVWTFETIDQSTCPSGFCVGAGVWSSAAIDTEFNTLYIGTGNAGRGCSPPSANATLYPDGILALNPANGQFKSFFQTFPNDLNDEGDIGASPALHDTRVVNQCTGSDQTAHWVTVPSKDSVVYTAPRGANGLLADPVGIPLNAGEAIASPAVVPVKQAQACGVGSLQTLETGNDIFVPTADGILFGIRQASDGSTSIRWQTLVLACDPSNPCPLFSAPAALTDLIVFGGGEGNLHISTQDGLLLKQFGTLGLVAGGPAISHHTIYFTSFDGFLYAISIDGQ